MRYVVASAVGAALLLLGGCANESDSPPATGQENTVSPSIQPPTSGPPTSGPPTSGPGTPAQGSVEQAKSELAARLGVGVGEVALVSSEEVTWRDASLGCPQPGMQYAQVLTDGSRIVLEARGKRYEYHAAGGRAPFLCTNPQPPLRSGG
jgi:hypothetical protein